MDTLVIGGVKKMGNVFESATSVLKSFIDNEPKTPLHVGEVMACWTYLASLENSISFEQQGLNMTTDNDVITMLNDAIKMCNGQVKRLKEFLLHEGVPLPPAPESKPDSNPNDVPLGVKLTDNEIVNGVSIKVAGASVKCATSQAESIRNDVGLMFLEFQAEHVAFGATLKMLMRNKGWIKNPPFYLPPGLPENE
jgi:hypothetical protein